MSLGNDRISIDSTCLSKNIPTFSLLDLPNEILLFIASDLGATDISHLSLSNRRLSSLLQSPLYDRAVKLESFNTNDPDHYHGRKPSALFHAASLGHEKMVQILLSKGADITFQVLPKGKTPLHAAVELGHAGIVKSMMEHERGKLAASIRDTPGMCPIHHAAQLGYEEIVRTLLENGAEVDWPSWGPDEPAATALHYAARYGHESIVRLLLENGAKVDARTTSRQYLVNCWQVPMWDLSQTPLIWVVSNPHIHRNIWWKDRHPKAIIELLISYGADINARNELGKTALHCAAELGVMGVDLCLVETLLGLGADPMLLTRNGDTALSLAVGCYYGAHRTRRKFMRQMGWKEKAIKLLEEATGGKPKSRLRRYISWFIHR